MMSRVLSLSFSFFLLTVLGAVPKSNAEGNPLSTCEEVRVHVRTLEGVVGESKDARRGEAEELETGELETGELELDKRIEDLRPKLSHLHYANYRLLAEKSVVIPITNKKVVHLSQGHKLTVRPLYANDERVGVWLKWKDGEGMEVIDSRMHFQCNEHMLTGLETNEDKGLVLAIQVSPIKEGK